MEAYVARMGPGLLDRMRKWPWTRRRLLTQMTVEERQWAEWAVTSEQSEWLRDFITRVDEDPAGFWLGATIGKSWP